MAGSLFVWLLVSIDEHIEASMETLIAFLLTFFRLIDITGFWGQCKNGEIHNFLFDGSLDSGEYGRIEMKVNNVQVNGANCFARCCMLRHDDPDPNQQHRWTTNAEGKYEFQTAITGTDPTKYAYIRFSSFITL